RVGRTHLPVWASILIVYIVLLGGVAMLVSLAAPPVLAQFQKLIDNVPMYADQADAASTKVISRLAQVLASWAPRADACAAGAPGTRPVPEADRQRADVRRPGGRGEHEGDLPPGAGARLLGTPRGRIRRGGPGGGRRRSPRRRGADERGRRGPGRSSRRSA